VVEGGNAGGNTTAHSRSSTEHRHPAAAKPNKALVGQHQRTITAPKSSQETSPVVSHVSSPADTIPMGDDFKNM
jgi:hypothetical protein